MDKKKINGLKAQCSQQVGLFPVTKHSANASIWAQDTDKDAKPFLSCDTAPLKHISTLFPVSLSLSSVQNITFLTGAIPVLFPATWGLLKY